MEKHKVLFKIVFVHCGGGGSSIKFLKGQKGSIKTLKQLPSMGRGLTFILIYL